MTFDELKERQAAAWGSAPFERISAVAANAHDDLVGRLRPQAAARWLDVATGTGAIAIRAARAGANVTGVDFAAELLETARRLAAAEGLAVTFDVGDAERLHYPDASYDVVASSFGVMFAPDQRAAAGELARVCRPGGRLGVMCWRPDGGVAELFAVMRPFQQPLPDGAGDPFDWGRREHVRDLLDDAFVLEFHEGEIVQTGESGEELWELFVTSFGPTKTLAESLEAERREQLRRAWVEFHERYRDGDGIRHTREYLITLGTRR